jgi:DNA gyrase subunit A
VIDIEPKEEDFVTMLISANTHSDLLFFTNKGKAYQIKMYDLPEGKRATKGKSIMNYLSLEGDEKVSWAKTMDGYTLLRSANGDFVYAISNDKGGMQPSTLAGGRPASFCAQCCVTMPVPEA